MIFVKSSKLRHEFSNTQISAPSELSRQLINWGKANIDNDDVYEPNDPDFGRELDSHVTVKFGLHTQDPEVVQKVIKNFGEFSVTLDKVSKFSSDDYDVIIVSVKSDKLHELNELISDKLACTDTHPTYKPHLTISYVNKNSCNNLVDDNTFVGKEWPVSEIYFSDKNGEKTKLKLV